MIQPVILCGGAGSRLWPMSRRQYPKQFLDFGTDGTLFANTVARASVVAPQTHQTVICNQDHRFLVAEQLLEDDKTGRIILEPVSRNTAPAIAAAALLHEKEDPVLLVMPADHMLDAEIFSAAAKKAEVIANEGYLVTFGIVPDYAETGYGYIEKGDSLEAGFHISAFTEKPSLKLAEEYVESGKYFWNSGIYMFRASVFLSELARLEPDMLELCRQSVANSREDLDFLRLDEDSFCKISGDSIDYAVMERSDKGAMVALEGAQWSDLGSWNAISSIGKTDADGNVVCGDIITTGTKDSYIRAESRLVATVGVENLVVVETRDAVLVSDKDHAQDVKNIFSQLDAKKRGETDLHARVYRPWGHYETIDFGQRFLVKRICVKPGQVLSLQMHHHRAEHWVVVKGTAKVRIGDKELILTEDHSTYIPTGTVHRLENPGKIPLDIIEIQTGAYLNEDDIVRLEDLYGRGR